jgi:hypothetical protein
MAKAITQNQEKWTVFNLETTQLDRAIKNAKALRPKVRMIRFGEYRVSGSKGNEYIVKCFRFFGEKVVDCNCLTKDGVACKHGVSAVLLHLHVAATRIAA